MGYRVLHVIAGNLNKGAARGALWLHEEMLSQGIDSFLFHTGDGNWDSKRKAIVSKRSTVDSIYVKIVLRIWRKYLTLRYPGYSGELFSSGRGLISLTKLEKKYKPDVIHLHWINHHSVAYRSIEKVSSKVVWTLRDMWPFTGGCHYAVGCNRYLEGCGCCPLLSSDKEKDLSSKIFKRKDKYFPSNVHFIGISEWILTEFKKAHLSSLKATFIPNGIQTKDWYPVNAKKEILDFAMGRISILVGALNLSAKYKGGEFVNLVSRRLDPTKFCIVLFGKVENKFLDELGLDVLNLGVISSNVNLRKIYSSCDVYLFPSLLEAFGKTVLESILCGTPVVCFDNSGPAEIVKHNETGYISKSFVTESLIEGIEASASMSIPEDIRNKTAKFYGVERIAHETNNLYHSI